MTKSYAKGVRETRAILTQAILETQTHLMETAREIDALVRPLFREIARLTYEGRDANE